jgi:hypothetical protein
MPELIHLPPESLLGTVQPIDRLVGEVAAYVGGEADPVARDKALNMLDRAADRLNMFGIYLFTIREQDYTVTNGDLVGNSVTVPMPDDFAWPVDPVEALDSDGVLKATLEWVAWNIFRHRVATQDPTNTNSAGIPTAISFPNVIDQTLHFWQPWKTSAAETLRVAYYARVQRPSEVQDQQEMRITPEAREAMLSMAVALIQQHRRQTQPEMWKPFMNDAERWLTRARGAAQRQQTALHTWIIPDEVAFQAASSRRLIISPEA